MANTIIGKILSIGEKVNVSKTGEFFKRELILDISRYDKFTGEKKENYASISFKQKHCDDLNGFNVGDMVEVAFTFDGHKWEKDGTTVYFNDISGYSIKSRERQIETPETTGPMPEMSQNEVPVGEVLPNNGLPF